MNIREVFKFVCEREQIRLRRERGEPKPWTKDPILQQYRFTNVRREDDKVTIWIRKNWREPHQDTMNCWFAMAVARYFNWPETLQAIGYPDPWSERRVLRILLKRQEEGKQVFGGAYFLNSIGPKIQSIVYDRLSALWNNRADVNRRLLQAKNLAEVHAIFLEQHGFGSFMAAQVVADIKHTPAFNEDRMPDWWWWAASGPGSRRGLNRILGRPVNNSWSEREWLEQLQKLQVKINPLLIEAKIGKLHAQDIQGICCCEMEKYLRTKLEEGKPKQKYPGVI